MRQVDPSKIPHIRQITVQHASHCRTCGKTIPVGAKAHWSPGGIIWHYQCDNPEAVYVGAYVDEAAK